MCARRAPGRTWRLMCFETSTPEMLCERASALLGRNVTTLTRIGGGKNSRVYRVQDESGASWALKIYFRHPLDTRDRLGVEYGSYSFLWANGFREVPRPILCDPESGWAFYEFIEGDRIAGGEIGEAQVIEAADFLGRLHLLRRRPGSEKFGPASEACFTMTTLLDNIRARYEKLMAAEADSPEHKELRGFLEEIFAPFFVRVIEWSQGRLRDCGGDPDRELAIEQRTLSPSDFGFHNALRLRAGDVIGDSPASGRIIFLDFEYFGWDDPAKMVADFLLHPAMDLAAGVKKAFAASVFDRFAGQPALPGRVESVYPLFGLKWCMIMLNEFLPASLQRRQFAAVEPPDRSAAQRRQLAKAREMLERINSEYLKFPYRD